MDTAVKNRVRELCTQLYDSKDCEYIVDEISNLIESFTYNYHHTRRSSVLTEKDIVLITYADMITGTGPTTLPVLHTFLTTFCKEMFNSVHILPCYPWTSDDGFSVSDYTSILHHYGDWSDIHAISNDFKVMLDAVVNHMSVKSEWFSKFLDGSKTYDSFFITVDADADLSSVSRPRNLPLLTRFNSNRGVLNVWTTFSSDQADLNYQTPQVLIEVLKVLLCYVSNGATSLRLDAIGYLWKEIGTSCSNHPHSHTMIKLFRTVLEAVSTEIHLITETNVPHADNVAYFGDGDEAHMVYQFALPPLIIYSVLEESASIMTSWAQDLDFSIENTTFFNFTASHDGIGLSAVDSILTEDQITQLCTHANEHGGNISLHSRADGRTQPYELNISYYNMLQQVDDTEEISRSKFILSQALMLAMPGVPAVYFHSLVGSWNYAAGVDGTGRFRTINREKLNYDDLESDLLTPGSRRNGIFVKLKKILCARSKRPEFSPKASAEFPVLNDKVFTIVRNRADLDLKLVAIHNVSGSFVEVSADDLSDYFREHHIRDIITHACYDLIKNKVIIVKPYQVLWFIENGPNKQQSYK